MSASRRVMTIKLIKTLAAGAFSGLALTSTSLLDAADAGSVRQRMSARHDAYRRSADTFELGAIRIVNPEIGRAHV